MILYSLIFIIGFSGQALGAPAPCPAGWTSMGNRCIKISDWDGHYEQARSWCKAFGTSETHLADLVSIRKADENTFIWSLAQQQPATKGKPLWIGLKAKSVEPTQWSDGTSVSSFKNYLTGTTFTSEACFAMDTTSAYGKLGKWYGTSCIGSAYFACEITVGFASDCSGYANEEPGLKMIELSDGTIMKTYCEKELTVVQSRGEDDETTFARTYEGFQETFGNPGKHTNFWFGLENLHLLIGESGNYNMVIQLCCGNKPGMTTSVSNVKLSDKWQDYTLSGNAIGNYGLNFLNYGSDLGSTFKTYITYKDGVEYCDVISNSKFGGPVKEGPGGFWIGSCANNLNGYYYKFNSTYFKNAENCVLDLDKMNVHGTGIEFRTDRKVDNPEYMFDSVSWTRVRMAIYPKALKPTFPNFCSDFKP